MNEELVGRLLSEGESEYLDFKEKMHKSNLELIHDILCLANSNNSSDRYIIYGVADNRDVVGVPDNEAEKWKTNRIVNILRSASLNRSLYNHDLFCTIPTL
jgi:predicted HTH transcriptional regulator